MPLSIFTRTLLMLLCLLGAAWPAAAQTGEAAIQTTWRLLDYIAVDYRGAVQDGRVINQLEYDEMREFTATVSRRMAALPAHEDRPALEGAAAALERAVVRRDPPSRVERRARRLAARLLAAYPVPVAPAALPDLARGDGLYRQHCAACHGLDGRGQTPVARDMDPPPIDFTDRSRARDRSLFALYQVIGQGLEGTAMQSFAHLPAEDRWALAFRIGQFAYPAGLAREGAALWQREPRVRARVHDVETLVGRTPAALAASLGEERAAAVTAFLRANPVVAERSAGARSLHLAHELLRQSLAAYRAGERARAEELALAAYLDGFEPVEALLAARDSSLVARVEREMGELRAGIARQAPATEIAGRIGRLQALFASAESAVSPEAGNSASTFLGAFAILLREGLEALLIIIAMITFLVRAERRDLLLYVHGGWVLALVAGVATWWAATNLITISGAERELTEGLGALLAAVILLFVGVWMHGKAQAGAWQRYVKEKLDRALSRSSAWLLFLLAFVAVYREVFETIIFYAALGAQGEERAMLAGIAFAAVLLAIVAWAMLRFSRRLPIATFFAWSAALIAVLAVVLAGKGIAALQEAGWIGMTPLPGFPRSPMLGLYPTLETLAAQLVTGLLLAAGFWRAGRPVPA